ncbi:MAG: PorV/PorQ family protein [Chitinophagales bacterium]
MFKNICTIIILALLLLGELSAQEVRKYSNEFLSLGVGARALAMGNAQNASVNDVTAGFWNPAGLTGLNNLQVGAMHSEWFAGIAKYDYASLALPISNGERALGLSVIRFGVDDIPNTLFIIEPDGSINYDNVTTFSAADYAFLFSYAQKIKKLNVGANIKVIHRTVGTFAKSWGFGLDIGAQLAVSENFHLGLTIKDLTTTINAWSFNFTEEEKQMLALTDNVIPSSSVELTGQRAILGGAYNFKFGEKLALLAEANLDFTFDGKRNVLVKSDFMSIDPHFGLELGFDNAIFLRGGMNNIQQFTDDLTGNTLTSTQPSAGIGIKIKELQIDYAFTGFNRVDDGVYSHIFSLVFNFSKNE